MTCVRAVTFLFFAFLLSIPMMSQTTTSGQSEILPCDGVCCDPDCVPPPSDPGPVDFTIDARTYEGIYPDIKNVYGNNLTAAANHYIFFGLPAGRRGGIIFDPVYYLANNADLAAAYGSTNYAAAAQHFTNTGLPLEGRRGSLEFDVTYYLANNPDLVAAFGSKNYVAATQHFLTQGLPNEGRRGSADVDIKAYINNYPDIRASYGPNGYSQAMLHWLRRGKQFGRKATGSPVTSSTDCTAATPPLIPGTNTPYSRVYIGLSGHDGAGDLATDSKDGSGTRFDSILRSYSGDPAAHIPAKDHLIVCILPGTYQTDGAYNWVINIPHNSEKIQDKGFAVGPYWHIHGNGDGSGEKSGTPTVVQLNSYYVPPLEGEPASLKGGLQAGTNVVFLTSSDTNPGVEISDLTIDANFPALKALAGTLPLRLEAIHLRDDIGGHYIHRVNIINAAGEAALGEAFPVSVQSVKYSLEDHAHPVDPPSQDNIIEFVTMSQWHGSKCTAITMAYATGIIQYNVVNGYQIAYGGWEMPFVQGSKPILNKMVVIHDNFSFNTEYGFNIDSEYNDFVNIQFNEIVNPQFYGIVIGGTGPSRFNNLGFLYNEIYLNSPGSTGVIFQGNVTNSVVARTNFLANTSGGTAINLYNPGNSGNAYEFNQIYSGLAISPAVEMPFAASCVYGNWNENGVQRSDFRNNTSFPCRPGL